jgi:hypothetical protein
MVMGIVAPPNPDKEFDGKVFLKRVSRDKVAKKLSYHQKFADNYHVNQLIVDGDWLDLCFIDDMKPSHLFESIMDAYDLDEEIGTDLILSYCTYPTRRTNTKKTVRVDYSDGHKILDRTIRTDAGGEARPIIMSDFTLHVRRNPGDTYQEDINCDSSFMLSTIHEIGHAIRFDKMDWVPVWEPIYLFMDNAGGARD